VNEHHRAIHQYDVTERALGSSGLLVFVPPYTFRIRAKDAPIARAISIAYADFFSPSEPAFFDFELSISRVRGLRGWINPLINIEFDGAFPFAPLPAAQAFPLLEWAMNWCVTTTAHQFLLCHSAVLAKDDRAVLLPAPPGSGKSTLCAALMLSGWRLLSDEIALIALTTPMITPFVRPISLKNTSIEIVARRFEGAVFTPPVAETIKGTVAQLKPTVASVRQSEVPAKSAWIIFPKYMPNSPLNLKAMVKAEAMVELAGNSFNLPALGVVGYRALASLVDQSFCGRLEYSHLDEAIQTFDALAEGNFPMVTASE
jgi:HprK-related kinase A